MSSSATIAILGAGGAVIASVALADPAALAHPADAVSWWAGLGDRQTSIEVLRGGRWVLIDTGAPAPSSAPSSVAAEIARLARARWGRSSKTDALIAALVITASAESGLRPDAGGDLDATGRAHAIGLWQLHDGLDVYGRARSVGAVGYGLATYQRRHPATAFGRLAQRIESSSAVQEAASSGDQAGTLRALTTAIIRPANPATRAEERVATLRGAYGRELVAGAIAS